MKYQVKILLFSAFAILVGCFTACKDDELGPSFFDTNDYPLDRSLYSFPLDTFVKVNFLEPYNLKFIYRMEDIGSDHNKNLTPAKYDKCVELAVLSKYLWYSVYEQLGGDLFLKYNSPRIIHVIGSKNYNPTQGTETLGVAEGGLKITLYNTNNLDVRDIDVMNEYFFKTMHHEFGHILDQTHIRPTSFNLLSRSQYDASTWMETPDSLAAGRGFVSPYASSEPGEDWVEVLANYVTRDTISWQRLLETAKYEWEEIDMEFSDYNKRARGADLDTVGYFRTSENGQGKCYRRVCARNSNDNVELDANGNVQWLHKSGIYGDQIIQQKIELVAGWLKDNWGISLYGLRKEVQKRQYATNPDGSFKFRGGMLVNNLTSPTVTNPSITVIDSLVNVVNAYKSLQK